MFFPSTSADDIREVLARYAVLAPPQPAPGPADWQRLRDKLGLAAAFAPTLKGVNQHRWRPGAPRRAAEIDAHELRIGVTFPAEYRAFLREIGDRAPGPNGTLRCLSGDYGDIARTRARWDGFFARLAAVANSRSLPVLALNDLQDRRGLVGHAGGDAQ